MNKTITMVVYSLTIYTGFLRAQADVNVQCSIRDSLSQEAIPRVRVTVKNLNKSFTTLRSACYMSLPAADYNFILEAADYETLTRTISVSTENHQFTFEMVKLTDRIALKQQLDTFYFYVNSLNQALNTIDMPLAKQLVKTIRGFGDHRFAIDEKTMENYERVKAVWIDSITRLARLNEDSLKLADALYYYRVITGFDSLNDDAADNVRRLDSLTVLKNKAPVTNQPAASGTKTKSPQEIETLFQKGVSKFIAGEFKDAIKIFREVLVYDPKHSKAKDYMQRAEARLKVIENQ